MLIPEKMSVNWQDYVRIFFHRKWFFFIPLAAVFTASIIGTSFFPKVYEAQTVILVEDEKIINPLISGLAVSTTVSERLQTLREEILSWPRMVQLVEELGLDKGVKGNKVAYEELIKSIRNRISVNMRGNDIIKISFQGEDAHMTQKVVATVADIFIRRNISTQSKEADTAIEFIQEQLDVYKKKLEDSEGALRKFKEIYAIQMPVASKLNDQLVNLEIQLTTLLIDCTEDHPKVIELRRMIENIKERRNEEIQKAAMSNAMNMDPAQYREIAESIPKQEEELARLTRDTRVNEAIYGMLLQRLETAQISQRLEVSEDGTKFRILEPARLPLKPIEPDRGKASVFGIFLGGLLGVGCVSLVEFKDHSFKSIEDAKAFLDKPILGSIAKIQTEEDKKKEQAKKRRSIISIFAFMAVMILIAMINYSLH